MHDRQIYWQADFLDEICYFQFVVYIQLLYYERFARPLEQLRKIARDFEKLFVAPEA